MYEDEIEINVELSFSSTGSQELSIEQNLD